MHIADERQVMSSQGKGFSISMRLLSGRRRYASAKEHRVEFSICIMRIPFVAYLFAVADFSSYFDYHVIFRNRCDRNINLTVRVET